MKEVRRRSTCPISSALDVVGDKWTLLVMRDILLRGHAHYREFLAGGEGIATNVLADRLVRLEAAGLVTKTDDDPRSGRQRYEATQKGRELVPVLLQLMLWSARHDPGSITPPELVEHLERDLQSTARAVEAAGGVGPILAPEGREIEPNTHRTPSE